MVQAATAAAVAAPAGEQEQAFEQTARREADRVGWQITDAQIHEMAEKMSEIMGPIVSSNVIRDMQDRGAFDTMPEPVMPPPAAAPVAPEPLTDPPGPEPKRSWAQKFLGG